MDYQSLIRSPNAAALFFLILQETDNGKTPFQLSYAQVSELLCQSIKQVRNAFSVLIMAGVLEITRKGTTRGRGRGISTQYVMPYKLAVCKDARKYKDTTKGILKGISKAGNNEVPFEGDNLTVEQQRYNGWLEFTKEKTPYVVNNIGQLTYDQFTKLRGRFGSKVMSEVIQQIENRKDLRQRYVSLYLTMINWCKNALKETE